MRNLVTIQYRAYSSLISTKKREELTSWVHCLLFEYWKQKHICTGRWINSAWNATERQGTGSRMLQRPWDFIKNLLLLDGQRPGPGDCSAWALQDNLQDASGLLRTDSAKVVRRWQHNKCPTLHTDFPRSIRKRDVYMSYLISPTQCTSPPSHHRTEGMKRRLKQHKLPHDEETEAPTLPYWTLLIFCTFQINIHETNNKKKRKQNPVPLLHLYSSFPLLSLWFHTQLCKKELHRSATEDSRKFL